MTKVIAFSGRSNSGKTTLIEKLIQILSSHYHVGVIKHDPKNKAIFDMQGKDSYRFFHNGADVIVTSPLKTTIMINEFKNINLLCEMFLDKDYIFIEGLKEMPFPRICVAREEIDKEYISFSDAFAIDGSVKNLEILPNNSKLLDLNNPKEILDWINKNAKEING
ncbi:molybdopterin-guanine dinucleotide biosynthesis protein B [Helicobacter sp. 11S03491-1]|uniref:molybdopterin-guanine dinucleotide biosynthesis protein B n=1 Tax=Helicobacter sp. 11S03491-1 TaxID=1476196 RepID=UPI000BA71DEE|nr:molybdopterin-guanine dinucleotide biosynthesis protein B [Helicobacter sp. 11S03491-1]PAF42314.1 molybdopterin-guanine dinucleotide biosynthesis protein B [Helicobacter sp. 11S03491-1]